MKLIIRIFWKWLPFAVLTTGLCGLVYLAVQQSLRANANDPQIQIVRDAVIAFSAGDNISAIIPDHKVDVTKSLSPFLIIYDNTGQVTGSNAELQGVTPVLPKGVLDYASQNGENRITWQPAEGVRIAAVIVPYPEGYVLSGRSLLEVEKREDMVFLQCTTAILVIWLTLLFLIGFLETFFVDNSAKTFRFGEREEFGEN